MEAPQSIGRYRIQRWLTSGAMGEIYEAHDPVIDRRVVTTSLPASHAAFAVVSHPSGPGTGFELPSSLYTALCIV